MACVKRWSVDVEECERTAGRDADRRALTRVPSGLGLEALNEKMWPDVEIGVAASVSGAECGPAWPHHPRTGRTAAMAIARNLDRATDSQWDWGRRAHPHVSRLGRHRRS